MPSTFERVAETIASTCNIPLDAIRPESHVINDLEIDSLDFLDVVFAIDEAFQIKLPVEAWTDAVDRGEAPSERFFVMRNLCERIDELVAQKAASPAQNEV